MKLIDKAQYPCSRSAFGVPPNTFPAVQWPPDSKAILARMLRIAQSGEVANLLVQTQSTDRLYPLS
jgi:hypothetical protein